MKRTLLTLCISLLLVSTVPVSSQAQITANLGVNLGVPVQDDFLGVNAIYHGFAFMPEQVNKGMDDSDRLREFDRVSRIGLNIARTWYYPECLDLRA